MRKRSKKGVLRFVGAVLLVLGVFGPVLPEASANICKDRTEIEDLSRTIDCECSTELQEWLSAKVSKDRETVKVRDLLLKVRETLESVQGSVDVGQFLKISKATLNLQGVLSKERGGALKLAVIGLGFGKKVRKEAVVEVSIVLVPPEDRKKRRELPDFSMALACAIKESAKALLEEAEKKGHSPTVPMELKKLTAAVRFGVHIKSNQGISLVVLPFEASLGRSVHKATRQELILEYVRRENPETSRSSGS